MTSSLNMARLVAALDTTDCNVCGDPIIGAKGRTRHYVCDLPDEPTEGAVTYEVRHPEESA